MHSLFVVLLSLRVLGGGAQSAAQRSTIGAANDSAGFVTLLGRDTIALESFSRTAARLQGEIVLRVPGTVHFRVYPRPESGRHRLAVGDRGATAGIPGARPPPGHARIRA